MSQGDICIARHEGAWRQKWRGSAACQRFYAECHPII
jgi:hypothetical protein